MQIKTIFISSSDAYADIWPAFFTLFQRHWPSFNGTIFLNTETRDFSMAGLNIVCTKVGNKKNFGATFKAGINRLPDEPFLLMMIDYFIEGPVDVVVLSRLYNTFCQNENLDSITLTHQGLSKRVPVPECPECMEICPPGSEDYFSFQTGFWRKEPLKRHVADWENPWMAEFYGCRRANIMKSKVWILKPEQPLPIPYDGCGVLHGGGRWLPSALQKIDLRGIPIDFTKRGTYVEPKFPRLVRIPREIPLLPKRFRSRMQLLTMRLAKCNRN